MTDRQSTVIVIAGPNGAGKSTLAPLLLRDRMDILDYVNADTIARGLSAFSPERAAFSAGRIMLRRLRDLARSQRSFAFETTLATRSYVGWLTELVTSTVYAVDLVFLWLRSADLAVARVHERVRLGGHSIPDDVVRRRYRRGVHNFLRLYSPVVTRWTVFDNSGPGQAALVATGGAGSSHPVITDAQLWSGFAESAT